MEGYQTEAAQLRHKLTQLDRLYNAFLLNRPRSASARTATVPSPSRASASAKASATAFGSASAAATATATAGRVGKAGKSAALSTAAEKGHKVLPGRKKAVA